jgi:hypothetical protein
MMPPCTLSDEQKETAFMLSMWFLNRGLAPLEALPILEDMVVSIRTLTKDGERNGN